MKNKNVLKKKISTEAGVGIVLLVAILIDGAFYLQNKKEVSSVYQTQIPNPQNQQGSDKQQSNNGQIISEAKDKNGCQNAAGLFWCNKKQSCVTNWNETCKNDNDFDVSQWDTYNTRDHGVKFDLYMKYPSAWFSPTDLSGDTTWGLPFYSKNDYTDTCQKDSGNKISCSQTGLVAKINVVTQPSIPRKVTYNDGQEKPVVINGYKGIIIEGVVNDTNGGFVAKNGEREISATFSNVKGKNFEIIMKINNDSDREVFTKIISSVKFNL